MPSTWWPGRRLPSDRPEAKTDPRGLKLEPQPILSNRDFVAYDTNQHIFAITVEAAQRMGGRWGEPRKPYVERSPATAYLYAAGAPFVVVASGEPVYLGAFSTLYSSWVYGVPTIQPLVGGSLAEATNVVAFRISADCVGFTRGPDGKVVFGPDVRSDGRILAALKRLGIATRRSEPKEAVGRDGTKP